MTLPKSALYVAALAGAFLLSGCSDDDPSATSRTEQEAARAYISALNNRDVDGLVELGPSGHDGLQEEARSIITADGGRGLRIKSVTVSHDVSPDEASTHVSGTDRRGKSFSTDIQMSREGDTWVVVLGHASGFDRDGKSPASTEAETP
ncbi:hypothetical protein [Streptomyces koelreuteriae]|uniref:hypothetical protein n=1 Tax=Streptomyces koelreuteriae TaxID=2838015 RepID=UPI003EBDE093